jgi:hypothetical protein
MSVVDGSFDHPLKLEERAAMPLAGGIMQQGYQCGMLWGAALAAGAQAYQLFGPGPQAEAKALIASQKLVESFLARNKHLNCSDITAINWKESNKRSMLTNMLKFFIKGGPVICFSMSAAYAPLAFNAINSTYTENQVNAPAAPVSCAALLAHKMGVSDLHATMASGFSGGIGLSGGACGALAASIWIIGIKNGAEDVKNIEYTPTKGLEAMDAFLQNTDYEFECAKIVGWKFENIADHAEYLRNGGCAKIIEGLAHY